MEENFLKNEKEISDFLNTAKNAEDFFKVQILSSNLLYNKTGKDIKDMIKSSNFYITAIENVFNNPNFLEAMGKVLEQYKSFQKNFDDKSGVEFFKAFDQVEIKNKKIIFSALVSSTILLVSVFKDLSEENIIFVSERILGCFKRLKNNFNPQYSLSEILFVTSGVFKREFYSKLSGQLIINDPGHCFEKQKVSSYLISLVVKLSFRNSRLNNFFKSIEKEKSKGKFSSYGILRLNNFIFTERRNEEKAIEALKKMLGESKRITLFFESFKKDRNEENAFNLIRLTLGEFKPGLDTGDALLNTISNATILTKNIQEYGKKNFRAFSGKIKESNYEWSNKIFINCCKLLGALNSLSTAIDKQWQIDASMKEFADWTFAVHKILNKYDIEDDWDKISKYLNQETNKVEWKSNFFTPTQTKKNDPYYNDIAQKCFHKIIKTMVGMMNSDGGVIIVGIVEKPDEIIEKDLRDSLIKKQGKFLFDVSGELATKKLDLDGIKRKIQDSLKQETLLSVDKFNNLWTIEQISIKSEDGIKELSIYKIDIIKSDDKIFSIKIEKPDEKVNIYKAENLWVSLLKRADSRTIYVDPRENLTE